MKLRNRKLIKKILLCGFFLYLIPGHSFAQEFPIRPINILVSVGPGSPMDVSTRLLSSKAQKLLGQPIIISNNGTGGGSVSLGIIAKEKPDGYHLISTADSMLLMTPQIRTVAYKPEDFVPIMNHSVAQFGLDVRADAPWKTLKEFVAYAKNNPGKVAYGSLDVGSLNNMAMQFIAKQEGIQWTLVPYTGGGASTVALLGGHIMAESAPVPLLLPHVKAGSIRLLATYGKKRMKSLPDVPTLRELGYDFVLEPPYVLAAPKGTPLPIVKKLDNAFHKAMDDPKFLQTIKTLELEATYRNSEDLKRFLEESYASYGKWIREFNISKDTGKK